MVLGLAALLCLLVALSLAFRDWRRKDPASRLDDFTNAFLLGVMGVTVLSAYLRAGLLLGLSPLLSGGLLLLLLLQRGALRNLLRSNSLN